MFGPRAQPRQAGARCLVAGPGGIFIHRKSVPRCCTSWRPTPETKLWVGGALCPGANTGELETPRGPQGLVLALALCHHFWNSIQMCKVKCSKKARLPRSFGNQLQSNQRESEVHLDDMHGETAVILLENKNESK